MRVRYVLLTLPVHRRPFQAYYAAHDREVEDRKLEVEREWSRSFDQLPPHIRIYWQDQWYWPPWFFNDAAGFVQIGSDGGDLLLADLYLRRCHFTATAPESFSRRHGEPADLEEIVFLSSLAGRKVAPEDNASYLLAIAELVAESRDAIRQEAQGLPEAQVWVPGFDLSCIDFARADRQLRERFPGRR
jgi:hypothetical protein